MNASEDVKILFRRFGGEANSYQEVVRERAAGQALGKWAMLGQVDILHPQTVQSVHRSVTTSATRHVALEPSHPASRIAAVHVIPPLSAAPQSLRPADAAASAAPQASIRTGPINATQRVTQSLPPALPTRPAVARPIEVTQAARSPLAEVLAKAPPATHPLSRPSGPATTTSFTPSTSAPAATSGHRSALGNSLNARLSHTSSGDNMTMTDRHSLASLFGRLAKSTFSFTSAPHSALQRKFAK
jgi:resuscitation-promoting factor RpfA